MKIEKTVLDWAKNRGYRVAAGGLELLEEVRSSLQNRRDKGEIEEVFFRNNLDKFSYLEGCRLKNPQSIMIIAVPRPAHILTFTLGRKTIETILPPTYVRYRDIFRDVREDLEMAASAHNFHLEILSAPLKALANRLGLILYGRNNIGYIDGLGSYFQLVGLVSDQRIDEIGKRTGPAQKLLPRCQECRICTKACPTGAIAEDRFLLHAEKCYTLSSESPEPIPEDLKTPSAKCLIGCLKCQQACPENRGSLRYEEASVSFDSEETTALIGKEGGSERAMSRVHAKFLRLGLTESIQIFARNLEQLLKLRSIVISGI